jgi:hypothetical protein
MQNLKTPTELLDMFPECGYKPHEIGYLLMLGLVQGFKVTNGCLISVTSFSMLLDYKKQFGRDKFDLGRHTNVIT